MTLAKFGQICLNPIHNPKADLGPLAALIVMGLDWIVNTNCGCAGVCPHILSIFRIDSHLGFLSRLIDFCSSIPVTTVQAMTSQPIYLLDSIEDLCHRSPQERRDAAENRSRLLETAQELFAQHGVAAVHMAAIAEEAGVGKGTLYRRFANKAELCMSLMDQQFSEFQEHVLTQLRAMTNEQTPFLEQLQWFLCELADFIQRHIPLLAEIQREGVLGATETTAPHFIWQQMTVCGLLRAARGKGELAAYFDIELLAEMFLAPLTAPYWQYLVEVRGFTKERLCAGLRTLVHTLLAQSSQPG